MDFPVARQYLTRILERNEEEGFYLFSGPEGAPLWSWMMEFFLSSACLGVSERKFGKYCGKCKMCREISARNSPDLFLLTPEDGKIGIQDAQKLQQVGSRKAFSRLFYIGIQRVEEMTPEALNSLLKFLEEPPSGTVLVLTTHHLWKVPPTIQSRAQILPFRRKCQKEDWQNFSIWEKIFNGFPEWLDDRHNELESIANQLIPHRDEFLRTGTHPVELVERMKPSPASAHDELLLFRIALLRALLRDGFAASNGYKAEFVSDQGNAQKETPPVSLRLVAWRLRLLGELEQWIRSTQVNRSLVLMYTFIQWDGSGR
ncbi:MAG: hypothetical protein V2G48_02515 [bacterium JZ-2024 1]